MMGSNGTIFMTIHELMTESGLPYKRIYNDIKSKKLKAVKQGKSYYIYTTDANEYIFNLICEARGVDPNQYRRFVGMDQITRALINEQMKEWSKSDKLKDQS